MQLIPCFILQLGAATRLQGITPAAIVHLLNYVRHTEQKRRRKQSHQKEERGEELCETNASLPQWKEATYRTCKNLFIPPNVQKNKLICFVQMDNFLFCKKV